MNFDTLHKSIGQLPFIEERNARQLYNHITSNDCQEILELGIAHGKSSCYIAAALKTKGSGRLTCVDLKEALDMFDPSAEELIKRHGLDEVTTIERMQSGYNWFLHNEIRKSFDGKTCKSKYDLIIIDGPKNWTIDSSSFFLCDLLLNDGGWIIWDDYNWTYDNADKTRDSTDGITHRSLDQDERRIPHVREIIELLVIPHPNYGKIIITEDTDWAWAQKIQSDSKSIDYKYSKSTAQVVADYLHLFSTSLINKLKGKQK